MTFVRFVRQICLDTGPIEIAAKTQKNGPIGWINTGRAGFAHRALRLSLK